MTSHANKQPHPDLNQLVEEGYTFFLNHSGGKDSQAMYLFLKNKIPKDQLVVIHAALGDVEWEGTIEHIENTIEHELIIAHAVKTFFDMVNHRKMFPDPNNRQCTSDLKRSPINREIRRWLKRNNRLKCISVQGIRAEESPRRSKMIPFKEDKKNAIAGRSWYDWYAIFDWSTDEVFKYIEMNNEKPHWAYAEGMSRLSCSFCIMARKSDLRIAAKLRPEMFKKYVDKEKELGKSMMMPVKGKKMYLDEYIK